MGKIICKECGKEFDDNNEVCPNCGYKRNKKKSKLKFIIPVIMIIVIAVILIIFFIIKNNETITDETLSNTDENIIYNSVGDTVETDIVRTTVDASAFAIALNDNCAVYDESYVYKNKDKIDTNTYTEYATITTSQGTYYEFFDEEYGLPTEYIQGETYNYIAATGHTLVTLTLTTENLDRTAVQNAIDKISVIYDSKKYECETGKLYSLLYKTNSSSWIIPWEYSMTYSSFRVEASNINYYYLTQNEAGTKRLYFDIPIEVNSLSDEFILVIDMPNSSGEIESFYYKINNK